MRPSRALILLLIVLALLQAVHYGPLLPDEIATHFDAAGQANEWTSKTGFLLTNLAFMIGMAALFFALPAGLSKIPNEWISMPNKDYWLAPERRAATLERVQRWSEWLGVATVALFLGITELTVLANLSTDPALGQGFWVLFGAYMIFMVGWVVGFLQWAFRKPPASEWPA